MQIPRNNLKKAGKYAHFFDEKKYNLDDLVNLVQKENNLFARDLVVHNLFTKIHTLLGVRYFRFYTWTPLETDDICTITFLAIDSAIRNFVPSKNVPFDYYVKLHSLLFFVQYARQFTFKRHYVLNRCTAFEDRPTVKYMESLLIDKVNPTPLEYTKYQICFDEVQSVLNKVSKVERTGLILRLQGYTYAHINKLLGLKRKRLEYIIKHLRSRCDTVGGKNLFD